MYMVSGSYASADSPAILDGQNWTPSVPTTATDVQLTIDPVGGKHPLEVPLPDASTWGQEYDGTLHGTVNHPSFDPS